MATSTKNTEQIYLEIKSIGRCYDSGKSVKVMGFSGKMIAKPDRPLGIIVALIEEMLPVVGYSSDKEAWADLDSLKKYLDSLEIQNDKAGS